MSENLLTLDVGNTAVKVALFGPNTFEELFRLPTDLKRIKAEVFQKHAPLIPDVLEHLDVAYVSVVPAVDTALQSAIKKWTGKEALHLTTDLPSPLQMAYHTPRTLGADRLAGAIGGWMRYGSVGTGLLIIDAGTAVNYEVVSPDGCYLGGAIAPGVELMLRALARGTAQLPQVEPMWPDRAIGRSTQECLQAGVVFMLADAVAGLIRRVSWELSAPLCVVSTGGWGHLLRAELPEVHHHHPALVHEGIHAWLQHLKAG
ncbi:MAG: type III pantothenate kinase [Bacteroidetes Order II. Incertae sedis bacterium]|nr:type III pantothenate kinase [Bacteroidetes Order II. bacterium]